MSGLASKQQSLKIFEKLKSKSANKVREPPSFTLHAPCPLQLRVRQSNINKHYPGLLRLRPEEPDLDLGSLGHLPVPRLLRQPSQPRRPHFLCSLYQPRPYVLPLCAGPRMGVAS